MPADLNPSKKKWSREVYSVISVDIKCFLFRGLVAFVPFSLLVNSVPINFHLQRLSYCFRMLQGLSGATGGFCVQAMTRAKLIS